MKKLVPLLALVAVPAGAQGSGLWPVQASGRACSMVNAAVSEASNPLTVTYDSGSGEVVLTIETSDITFDYVPGHAERKGGLFFRQDPRMHKLELRALGYQTP